MFTDDSAESNSSSLAPLYRELKEFIAGESRAQREQYKQHINRPVEERVLEERCLANLRFERTVESGRGSTGLRFSCEGRIGNSSRFREGERLALHRGEPKLNSIDVALLGESERSVVIRPESQLGSVLAALKENPGGWLLDEGFFDPQKLLTAGLEEAMDSADGRDRVLALFAGTAQSEMAFGLEDFEDAMLYAEEAGLNETQAEGLAQAVTADHCHLIQGPPGTGKTYVLAQTVATLVERGERVLLTAFTHRAIHHALKACHAVIRDPDRIGKIGFPIFDPSLAPIQQYESFAKSPLRRLSGGFVVGATPYSAFSRRMAGISFDTVVVDEASQMTVPLAVLALLRGRKFVFFGDHRQLPPVLMSVPKREAAQHSVFGSLARNTDITTLNTTYRLNGELSEWPSESFYSGRLQPAATVESRKFSCPNRPPSHPALACADSLVFLELSHEDSRTSSREEAETVADIIEDAVLCGMAPSEIGVVTPFRRQARRIKRSLRASSQLPVGAADEIVIDTVERFQGQERELVVLSLTISDISFLEKIADFYFQEERWNVAATRARSKLVIVGSRELRTFAPLDAEIIDQVSLVHSLLRSASVIRQQDLRDWSDVRKQPRGENGH